MVCSNVRKGNSCFCFVKVCVCWIPVPFSLTISFCVITLDCPWSFPGKDPSCTRVDGYSIGTSTKNVQFYWMAGQKGGIQTLRFSLLCSMCRQRRQRIDHTGTNSSICGSLGSIFWQCMWIGHYLQFSQGLLHSRRIVHRWTSTGNQQSRGTTDNLSHGWNDGRSQRRRNNTRKKQFRSTKWSMRASTLSK